MPSCGPTDLSQRGRGRRKIIYVISDGKNQGSTASYKEVVRYLFTNQIAVNGTLVGDSALPVYGFLDRFHIPWQMADNLLPKYASATGGILDAQLSRNAIEASFARVAGQVPTNTRWVITATSLCLTAASARLRCACCCRT